MRLTINTTVLGILNDKVNSVGARFVTNILAAMKQRKVLHPHPPTA